MLRGAPSGATPVISPIEKKPCELADIFAKHGEAFHRDYPLPARHLKVMRRIIACRTKALGGHRHWCDDCGFERSVYHSCRDRHCPKCQVQAKDAWQVHANQALRLSVKQSAQSKTGDNSQLDRGPPTGAAADP